MRNKTEQASSAVQIIPAGRRPERFAREAGISRPTLERLNERLPAELRPRSIKLGDQRSSPRIYVESPQEWLARLAAAQQAA